MAFWKKSDDPWDRKPGKKTETAWWEQEPVGAGHPAGPFSGGYEIRPYNTFNMLFKIKGVLYA